MATFYRQYRPQIFAEIVGQNHIKITLEQEIASGNIAHAYLFCGPRGIGKTTLARILAKAINCEKRKEGEYEPCNVCRTCREITAGSSFDVVEVDAASHTGVDNIRENIIANARLAPNANRYKIFIIDEVHMLSVSAFNALLKILEEPPAYVVFILCTTEVHKIPTTIISRCQRFDFKRINISDVSKKLAYIAQKEKIKVNKKILEAIARHSEGHMRDAESLFGQVVAVAGARTGQVREITMTEADLVIPRSDLNEAINLFDFLAKKDAGSAIWLLNKLIDEGIDLKQFLSDLIELLRKIMLLKVNPALADRLGLEMGEEIEVRLGQVAQAMTLDFVLKVIEKLTAARIEVKNSFIEQLPVEVAITEICLSNQAVTPVRSTVTVNTSKKNNQIAAQANQNSTKSAPEKTLLEKWPEVLAKIKQHNHSLSFILRVCQPQKLEGNKIYLAFKYKFHKDRVEEINIKRIVEKVLSEVYGQTLLVEAIVDETLEVSQNVNNATEANFSRNNKNDEDKNEIEGNELIDNLLKTFGGRIVE